MKYIVEFTKEQYDFVKEQMTNFSQSRVAVGRREREAAVDVLPALNAVEKKEA